MVSIFIYSHSYTLYINLAQLVLILASAAMLHHIQNKLWSYTSLEVVQASITLQHNTLHCFCLYHPPPSLQNNLPDSFFTEQLPDLNYIDNRPGLVCLVVTWISTTVTNQTNLWLITLFKSFMSPLISAVKSLTWLLFDLTMTSMKNLLLQSYLNQIIIALNPSLMFQSLCLLPYTRLLGTLLTFSVHHLLLHYTVFQNFHLLKRSTSTVTFCTLC